MRRFSVFSLEMFDWNDEELSNIIWGETGETDDHIVPYQEGKEDSRNKKKWNRESNTIETNEEKTLSKPQLHVIKPEGHPHFDNDGGISAGFHVESWTNLSSSNAARKDQLFRDTKGSKDVGENSTYDSVKGIAQSEGDSEVFASSQGKEPGDFVDYSWENIRSFDDLEQIFSNDVPIFGNVSLGNADELWSSSKDITSNSTKSFSLSDDPANLGLGLTDTSEFSQVKTKNLQQDDQSANPGYKNVNDRGLLNFQSENIFQESADYGAEIRESKPEQKSWTTVAKAKEPLSADTALTLNKLPDKDFGQKKPPKLQNKQDGQVDAKLLPDTYGAWSSSGNLAGQYENQFPSNVLQQKLSSASSQPRQFPGPGSFHPVSKSYICPAGFGNVVNTVPAIPPMSHIPPGVLKGQTHFQYEVSPGSIPGKFNGLQKPPAMTPQEKIEKLRRRQQMQAILAIQKQQQQFGQRLPAYPVLQNPPLENQMLQVEGTELENDSLNTLCSADTTSSIEQDESNIGTAGGVEFAVEGSVLHRLQDAISKLDDRIKLSIRDSLFRLAESAEQRHQGINTTSSSMCLRHEEESVAREELNANNRKIMIPDAETETNPIDRAVAHLLFHRPFELPQRYPGTPESPNSAVFTRDGKPSHMGDSPSGGLSKSSRAEPSTLNLASKGAVQLTDVEHVDTSKGSPSLEISEKASSNMHAGDGK